MFWKTKKCVKIKIGKFTMSVCKFDGIKLQGLHFALHLGIAIVGQFLFGYGVLASIFVALGIEIWDGLKQTNKEGRPPEGFNFFPDLAFRVSGASALLLVL